MCSGCTLLHFVPFLAKDIFRGEPDAHECWVALLAEARLCDIAISLRGRASHKHPLGWRTGGGEAGKR